MKALGWEPKIGLREGIESTYKWYKNNIGYEDPVPTQSVNPISRFMSWMDQE
jgi:dTDP-D-glucose 4,6-dehydratase